MAKAPTLPDDNEPITARQLIELAKIETSARDDAVQRIPTATDTTPPNSVLLAKEIITNRIEARHRALLNGISHIQQLIDAIPDPRLDRNIATLAGQVEAAVMLPFQDSEPMTRKAVGEERDARSLYKSWRDARGLHGVAPIYPLSRINHFATVAVSAVVEAVLTGTMYMNATPDGLSGAITIALGVPASTQASASLAACLQHAIWPIPVGRCASWRALPLWPRRSRSSR